MWDKAINADSEAIKRHPEVRRGILRPGQSQGRASRIMPAAVADFNEAIRLFELRGGLNCT